MGSAFLPAMFFASGAAALIYQVVFSKALTYVFGSMSTATNTVLATYMGGIALGTWLGGLLAPRLRRPVAAYAVCEVLIAIYCAASPWVFDLVRNAYVALAFGQTPDAAGLLPLRVMLGGAGLLVPTMLMGLTLPILVSHFEHHKGAIGVSVGKLYAANTLGAATGALMTGYFVLPALGVHRTTLLAVALNLLVAYFAFRFQRSLPEEQPAGRVAAASAVAAGERSRGWTAIALLTIGGFVTLALEVDYIHLLAVAAGNSTYAFSLMLFAFLLGLGGGSELARRFMGRFDRLQLLAWLEFGLCITIILGASAVDRIPEFFAGFSEMTLGWGVQELIRGAVCCAAMIPPALFIGAIFPIAIDCVGLAFPDHPIRMLGYASALNTLGNILGVLVAGFVLLPTIGPFASVKLLAGVCLLLGACAAMACSKAVDGTGAGSGRRTVAGTAHPGLRRADDRRQCLFRGHSARPRDRSRGEPRWRAHDSERTGRERPAASHAAHQRQVPGKRRGRRRNGRSGRICTGAAAAHGETQQRARDRLRDGQYLARAS
jgi:predicted membrane-bound spermidine synthase